MATKAETSRYIDINLQGGSQRSFQSLIDRLMRILDKSTCSKLDAMNKGLDNPIKVVRHDQSGTVGQFVVTYQVNWPSFEFKKKFTSRQTKNRNAIEAFKEVIEKSYSMWIQLHEERGMSIKSAEARSEDRDELQDSEDGTNPVIFRGSLEKAHLPMISDIEVLRFLREFNPVRAVEVYALRFLLCYSVDDMANLLGVDASTINRMEKAETLTPGQVNSVRGGLLHYPDLHHIVDLYQTYANSDWFEYLEKVNAKNWPKSYRPTCKVCHSDEVEIRPDSNFKFFARCTNCGEERASYKMSEIRFYLLHLLRVKIDLTKDYYFDYKAFQKHITELKSQGAI
ncbi:hypothetical protein [Vibrio owensii]|uniref:hypothetical protein n=1 Tax=Vibrio owensii TaxID=696485 RepID=UPI0018F14EC1|nr:hypothetical protein [Vibrio owensii]